MHTYSKGIPPELFTLHDHNFFSALSDSGWNTSCSLDRVLLAGDWKKTVKDACTCFPQLVMLALFSSNIVAERCQGNVSSIYLAQSALAVLVLIKSNWYAAPCLYPFHTKKAKQLNYWKISQCRKPTVIVVQDFNWFLIPVRGTEIKFCSSGELTKIMLSLMPAYQVSERFPFKMKCHMKAAYILHLCVWK